MVHLDSELICIERGGERGGPRDRGRGGNKGGVNGINTANCGVLKQQLLSWGNRNNR